ncbi:MAG: cupin domain-containing protein [Peptococcaceae bacterium]|jgi:quercetin dioxygenase-like cupin family protein|nr:cupin domain-containing protein [Peptococcaceae bacterium]MDH7525653.1 cupin domain-containing protein [Peptococcaceae bacterium]
MSRGKVNRAGEAGYRQMLPGVERKTLVYGDNTLLSEFRLSKGAALPAHKHPQEQTGYLVAGRIVLTVNGERHDLKPGDSWVIPGNEEHSVEVAEDSLTVETFSPVREDYI